MSRLHTQITLDEAEPGMVLAADLLDTQGQVLLPGGATLSENSITSLRKREVDTLSILGDEVAEADHAEELAEYEERLARVFRKHDEQDMATEILRQFVYNFRFGAV